MFPQKMLWASLTVAMLGCGPLLRAEDSVSAPSVSAESKEAIQRAGAPIPVSADSPTERDLLRLYLAWYKRRFVPPMQAVAKGQPWEAAASKFVDDSFTAWVGLEGERTTATWSAISARGDELLKGGCGELTVRYLTAHARILERRNAKAAIEEYRRILDLLEKDARYPKALALLVAENLRAAVPAERETLDRKIVELMRQSVEEGSFSGADDVIFVDNMLRSYGLLEHNPDAAEKAVTGLEKLPEWARETILGKVEAKRAWRARGGGYANTVTADGWKGFSEGQTKARAHLEAAWKLRPDQPYAAAEMISVTMGSEPSPGELLRTWFDRTVKARFDFEKAYQTYMWGILPRWGGGYDEMLAFGRACAATKRYDTNVPNRLIVVIDQIGKELSKRREIYQVAPFSDEVVALDKAYAAAPAPPGYGIIRLSNLALDAWLCRKWADGKAAIDQLPEHKLSASEGNRLAFFFVGEKNVIGETFIYSGPAGADYGKARDLDKEGRYDEAAASYSAAMKASAGQPEAQETIAFLTKLNDTRIEMEKGEWKDISPKVADHSEWWLGDLCTVPEDGVLQMLGRGHTTLSRWRRPVGENYEVRATFEFLTPLDKAHLFEIALRAQDADESVACQFYSTQATNGRVHMLHGWNYTSDPVFDVELGMKNHVQLQCWKGLLSVYLNGKKVFERLKTEEGTPSDHFGEIAFGGYGLTASEGFRVSDIAVRVLKAAPTPPDKLDDDK